MIGSLKTYWAGVCFSGCPAALRQAVCRGGWKPLQGGLRLTAQGNEEGKDFRLPLGTLRQPENVSDRANKHAMPFVLNVARLGPGGGRGFGEEGFNAAVAVHIDALHGWGHGVSFLLIGWDGWMEWFSGCLRGA